MWTHNETELTTTSMVAVSASTLKIQSATNDPDVIQLIIKYCSRFAPLKYLKKIIQDNIVEKSKNELVMIWAYLSEKVLPKKEQYKKPNNGKNTVKIIKFNLLIY